MKTTNIYTSIQFICVDKDIEKLKIFQFSVFLFIGYQLLHFFFFYFFNKKIEQSKCPENKLNKTTILNFVKKFFLFTLKKKNINEG